jgi:hypothetical protein
VIRRVLSGQAKIRQLRSSTTVLCARHRSPERKYSMNQSRCQTG